jgi:hypothetical protein
MLAQVEAAISDVRRTSPNACVVLHLADKTVPPSYVREAAAHIEEAAAKLAQWSMQVRPRPSRCPCLVNERMILCACCVGRWRRHRPQW